MHTLLSLRGGAKISFSWIPNKPLLGMMARAVLPKSIPFPILSGALRGKKWIIGTGNIEYLLGTYELDKQRLFQSHVRKSSVVYDVGAHLGFYTLLASHLVGERGQVVAFEPSPENLEHIRKHVQINNASNVSIVPAAVSDSTGTRLFSEGASSSTGKISETGKLNVDSVSIDDLVFGGTISKPDFIKMDIEGAELEALKGAHRTLSDHSPTLFLAIHGSDTGLECRKLLAKLGYGCLPIGTGSIVDASEIVATMRLIDICAGNTRDGEH